VLEKTREGKSQITRVHLTTWMGNQKKESKTRGALNRGGILARRGEEKNQMNRPLDKKEEVKLGNGAPDCS